jgi:hypothetical protein
VGAGPRRYFFATAQYVTTTWVADRLVQIPTSLVHAKEMGTTRTLCGERATSWTKMWDQPFRTYAGTGCPRCEVVANGHGPGLAPNQG